MTTEEEEGCGVSKEMDNRCRRRLLRLPPDFVTLMTLETVKTFIDRSGGGTAAAFHQNHPFLLYLYTDNSSMLSNISSQDIFFSVFAFAPLVQTSKFFFHTVSTLVFIYWVWDLLIILSSLFFCGSSCILTLFKHIEL